MLKICNSSKLYTTFKFKFLSQWVKHSNQYYLEKLLDQAKCDNVVWIHLITLQVSQVHYWLKNH